MSGRRHPHGCDCRTHAARPWRRPEHWSRADVQELERRFGLVADEVLARRFGRTVVAVRLKAKRLGLRKRAQAFTGRDVAAIFGIDASTVGKVWVRRGLLASVRPFRQGPYDVHLIDPRAVERFIVEHPEYVDVDKMPDSPYRDLAARDPWISLPEVHRRTGRDPHKVAEMILAGTVRGRRRGSHWYVPVADLALIRPLRSRDAIEESWFRRQSVLEARRNRRKGTRPRLTDGRTALSTVQRIAS